MHWLLSNRQPMTRVHSSMLCTINSKINDTPPKKTRV